MPSWPSERSPLASCASCFDAAEQGFGSIEDDEIDRKFKTMLEIPVEPRGVGIVGETQIKDNFRLRPYGYAVKILEARGVAGGACTCCSEKCDAECRIFFQSDEDARQSPPLFHPVLNSRISTGSSKSGWFWDEDVPIGGRYCPEHMQSTSTAQEFHCVGLHDRAHSKGGYICIKVEVWRRRGCTCLSTAEFVGETNMSSNVGLHGLPFEPASYQLRSASGTILPGRRLRLQVCRLESQVPVRLNVYSLGNSESLERLNEMAKGRAAIVHVGLEIAGAEWSYGYTLADQANNTGVFTNYAAECRMHTFKWSHELGTSPISPSNVASILAKLSDNSRWYGENYALLENNCCHFCYELASALEVTERFPHYVDRLARAGHRLAQGSDYVQKLQQKVVDGRYSPFQIDRRLGKWCSDGVEPYFDACACCCTAKWDGAASAMRINVGFARASVYIICWLIYNAPAIAVPAYAVLTTQEQVGIHCGYEDLTVLVHGLRVSAMFFLATVLAVVAVPVIGTMVSLWVAQGREICLGSHSGRPENPAIDYLAGAPWFRFTDFAQYYFPRAPCTSLLFLLVTTVFLVNLVHLSWCSIEWAMVANICQDQKASDDGRKMFHRAWASLTSLWTEFVWAPILIGACRAIMWKCQGCRPWNATTNESAKMVH